MSTYAWIHADVELEPEAAAAFRSTPSWTWFTDSPDDPALAAATLASGALRITLTGDGVRNLCRFLTVDLARAQEHGSVLGLVTIDCSDGEHWRSVSEYTMAGVLHGVEACYHQPVDAEPSEVRTMDFGGGAGFEFAFLAPLASPPAPPVRLTGHLTSVSCGCGGYDAQDNLICATT